MTGPNGDALKRAGAREHAYQVNKDRQEDV
jgi:hypothetical protein